MLSPFARSAAETSAMPDTPEQKARRLIDAKPAEAGWLVQDRAKVELTAVRGVTVSEFNMKPGFGFAESAASLLSAKLSQALGDRVHVLPSDVIRRECSFGKDLHITGSSHAVANHVSAFVRPHNFGSHDHSRRWRLKRHARENLVRFEPAPSEVLGGITTTRQYQSTGEEGALHPEEARTYLKIA